MVLDTPDIHATRRICCYQTGDVAWGHLIDTERLGDVVPRATRQNRQGATTPALQNCLSDPGAGTVTNDGKFFLDTIPCTLQELEQRLIQQKTLTPDFPVVIRGDSLTQYQAVMDVIDVVGRIGLTQVGLATKPAKK